MEREEFVASGFFKKTILAFLAGILVMLLLAAGILFWQKSYFESFLRAQPPDSQPVQAVVVFEGDDDYSRLDKGVEVANRRGADYLIVTTGKLDEVKFEILKADGLRKARLWLNQEPSTTDSDARYAAEVLKKLKVQRAVLVTSWFHLPRSNFLLRLYLAFSGIHIVPIAADSPPEDAENQRIFQMEYVKLWGSLGRAGIFAFKGISHPSPTAHP
jgi:uncharacterized SAM-binding protein YcdF (DUF218 family)